MNSNYINKYNNIFQQIGDHAKIVLATSHQDKVTARKMSFLIMNGIFIFKLIRLLENTKIFKTMKMLHYVLIIFKLKVSVKR